ncbi:response regulator transcription factor [Dactylosporangium sp. CA-092794]|uniref:response regulator transcription factor n=1 Tax=Dactylosporangium sp. CA-092794 TaxID=3239929 RepID=UPI003D89BBD7
MCAYILVAEDDPKQAEAVRLYLEREGHAVDVAGDGRTALDAARRRPPDLLVLDLMLPGVDGLAVCHTLRRESDVPIIMVTARSTEDDLLLGLDVGADDYVTKPYSARELVARVRTLLRRARPAASRRPVHVDAARHEVTVDGRLVDCTPVEFAILAALAAQPGRVFSRRQLLAAVHGLGDFITERTVDVHVMKLRRKIEPEPDRPARLVTVYGVGYKLNDR